MNDNIKYCKRIADELKAVCDGDAVTEDGDEMSLHEYFIDALDWEYTITRQKEYIGVKVWMTLGGPNVWIDTTKRCVKLAWGTDCAEYPIDDDINNAIDDYFEDYYNYWTV